MIIIGITGTLGAGKGTVVEYLEEQGFLHYSARQFIATEIKKRGLTVDRDTLTSVGNDIRTSHSPSFIIENLYEQALQKKANAVIESIRTEGEAAALRKHGEFSLIAVDADPTVRYQRIVMRNNETDHISFEKFIEDEAREMHATDPNKQNLSRCIELADYRISNNGDIQTLRVRVDEILKLIALK